MPQQPRLLVDDACYHVLTRGNNRAAVFHRDEDRQRYARWLRSLSLEHGVKIYHYCLMTNHVHLVVRVTQGVGLRQLMQRLNLIYAQYLQRTYGHVGHVWQGRFKSLLIADDAHLLQCGGYVELNPVRANIVADPVTYPWSSFRTYAQGSPDPLVTPSPAYLALGQTVPERQARYRQFVLEQLQPLPTGWFRRPVLGKVEAMTEKLGADVGRLAIRPRGRPRKKAASQAVPVAAIPL